MLVREGSVDRTRVGPRAGELRWSSRPSWHWPTSRSLPAAARRGLPTHRGRGADGLGPHPRADHPDPVPRHPPRPRRPLGASAAAACGRRPSAPPSWAGPHRLAPLVPADGQPLSAAALTGRRRSSRSTASSPTWRRRSAPSRGLPPTSCRASATPTTRASWSPSCCPTPGPTGAGPCTATRGWAGPPTATSRHGPTRTAPATTRRPTSCSSGEQVDIGHLFLGLEALLHPARPCPSRPTACPTSTPPAGWPTSAWPRSGPPSTSRAPRPEGVAPLPAPDRDAYYLMSAPDADLLGDVDVFAMRAQWALAAGEPSRPPCAPTTWAARGGRPACAGAGGRSPRSTVSPTAGPAAGSPGTRRWPGWVRRIDRFNDVYGAGVGGSLWGTSPVRPPRLAGDAVHARPVPGLGPAAAGGRARGPARRLAAAASSWWWSSAGRRSWWSTTWWSSRPWWSWWWPAGTARWWSWARRWSGWSSVATRLVVVGRSVVSAGGWWRSAGRGRAAGRGRPGGRGGRASVAGGPAVVDGPPRPEGMAGAGHDPALVEAGPAEHRVHVRPGMVVGAAWRSRAGSPRSPSPLRHRYPAALTAASNRFGAGDPVGVAVAAQRPPGRGDELHRPDRPVPGRVPVPAAAVAVGDAGHPAAVQRRAGDPRAHRPGRAEPGRRAPEQAVVGLDAADAGQDRPGEPAVRGEPGRPGRGLAVGAQGEGGDGARPPAGITQAAGVAVAPAPAAARRAAVRSRSAAAAASVPRCQARARRRLLGGARLTGRDGASGQRGEAGSGGQGAARGERGGRDRPEQQRHRAAPPARRRRTKDADGGGGRCKGRLPRRARPSMLARHDRECAPSMVTTALSRQDECVVVALVATM